MDHYLELLAFCDRVAKCAYGETLEGLTIEARRITGAEETAAVHLGNECPECNGAGYFDAIGEPEKCAACNGSGNAIRKITPALHPVFADILNGWRKVL